MANVDWQYLKKSLVLLAVAILLSASIGYAGYYFETDRFDAYQQSVSTLRATHRSYRNLVSDLELLDQYRAKFREYKSSGLVGEERRLSWIESLQSTNGVLKLPTLTYNLLPQEKFARPGFSGKPNVKVNSSPMVLNMGLMHEEDLFAVLEGLRLSIKNLFTVDSCTLSRTGNVSESLSTKSANLRSNCVIRWVTINAS